MKISTGNDVFTKAELVKNMVEEEIGVVTGDMLLTLMCHLNHFWLDRRKEPLTEKEMTVYSILNKEKLNPCTVYSWFLASKAPSDVRLRYERGKINSRELTMLGRNEVEKERCRKGLDLIREIKDTVEEVIK